MNTKLKYDYDDDEDYVPTKKVKYSFRDDNSNPTQEKTHTLDSDEEDEDEHPEKKQFEILEDEDIDGQEDATVDIEGETKITPFNMKEEMEEGHFDKDGFYHFKKDSEALKDAWLDNIDWVKVRKEKDGVKKYGSDVESDAEEDKLPHIETKQEKENTIAIYEQIIPYLKEGETISKALKRLSGNNKRLSSAQRWKLKKQGLLPNTENALDFFLQLTELINKIIETGNMDIYEETFEMIRLKIDRFKTPAAPALDMFADESSTTKKESSKDNTKNTEEKDTFDKVEWEFKWEDNESAQVFGPVSTEQMLKWKESHYFKDGVNVRKTSERAGRWYQSSRVDFELYI